mgnify:CR=1 FL=1
MADNRKKNKSNKNGAIGVIDIGSSKICCLMAKPETGLGILGPGESATASVKIDVDMGL